MTETTIPTEEPSAAFKRAANEEALRRFPDHHDDMGFAQHDRQHFFEGATWARTEAAATPVPDDRVRAPRDDDHLSVGDALRSLDVFPDADGKERLVDAQEVFDLLAHRGVLSGTKLVSTIEALDELPAGTVLKGWNGGIWEVTERDESDGYRYVSPTWSSYFESKTMIANHQMFTVLHRGSAA